MNDYKLRGGVVLHKQYKSNLHTKHIHKYILAFLEVNSYSQTRVIFLYTWLLHRKLPSDNDMDVDIIYLSSTCGLRYFFSQDSYISKFENFFYDHNV